MMASVLAEFKFVYLFGTAESDQALAATDEWAHLMESTWYDAGECMPTEKDRRDWFFWFWCGI